MKGTEKLVPVDTGVEQQAAESSEARERKSREASAAAFRRKSAL